MNQRSHIILCMSHNKICRRRPATRFGADNEKKSVHGKEKLSSFKLDVTSMATMKKIILCVLLALFFLISLTIHWQSFRDYGFELLVLLLLAAGYISYVACPCPCPGHVVDRRSWLQACSARLHTIGIQLCRHGIWVLACPYTKYTLILVCAV
jgi:hypothetical protein